MRRTPPGPLKPDRAFLVQLREENDGRRRLSGRVEHVVSGASEPFGSLTALLDFMARHAPSINRPSPSMKRPSPSMKRPAPSMKRPAPPAARSPKPKSTEE